MKVKKLLVLGCWLVFLLIIYVLAVNLPTSEATVEVEQTVESSEAPKAAAVPEKVETIEAPTTEEEKQAPKTETATAVKVKQTETPKQLDPAEVELLGRTIWGEAGGIESEAERAAVAWCILNRVDAYGWTIEEVITAPNQFLGYTEAGECPQEHKDLAADVLARWYAEKAGAEDVGRVLPAEYLYFIGDGEKNHFSIEWQGSDYWDWSLRNPYIEEPAELSAKS